MIGIQLPGAKSSLTGLSSSLSVSSWTKLDPMEIINHATRVLIKKFRTVVYGAYFVSKIRILI